MNKHKIADYWTKNAPYKESANPNQARLQEEPFVKGLMDRLADKRDLLLEIGCGLGYDSDYFRKKEVFVVPIDLSSANAQQAKGLCMDAEHLDFHSATFDKVYSFGCLHHTPDTQQAINEVYRVLKPGGKAMIMLYHKGYAYWILLTLFWWDKDFTNRYDHTPLSKMFSKKQIGYMFKQFKSIKIEMTTFQKNKWVWAILSKSKWLMNRFGQFAIVWLEK